MKTKIKFYFICNKREWFWTKVFYIKPNESVADRVSNYLSHKTLPFDDMSIDDIKWKCV